MNFLNTIPLPFWFLALVPLIIFLLNRRQKQIVKFSSIRFLLNLKTNEINRIKLINIILLILRTLIVLLLLIITLRPYLNESILSSDFSDKKIHNYILVDDSFYNKFGYLKNDLRINYIDRIVSEICHQYGDKSRLTIASLNKGILYDGFNKNKINYSFIDNQIHNYSNIEIFLKKSQNNVNNLHLISNLGKDFIDYVDDKILNNDKDFYNIYYYHLPAIETNVHISNVKLFNTQNDNFQYSYELGNIGITDKDLSLSIYKNDYLYDTLLRLKQKIPLFSETLTLKKNESLIDTLNINIKRDFLSELVFKLENTDKSDFYDSLNEDNSFSFINNKFQNINTAVIFNNQLEKKYINSILNSFKVITNEIDSSFFNISFINENKFNKFSKDIVDAEVFIFFGYKLFSKIYTELNDVINNEKKHFLVFPSIDDLDEDQYKLNINDSLVVELERIKYTANNFDTLFYNDEKYKYLDLIKNNKLKLYDYFRHNYNNQSNFSTTLSNSVWSTFYNNNITIDLFGFMVGNGNNFLNSESLVFTPLLYDIILNQKIDFNKNNLFVNDQIKLSHTDQKYKFIDTLDSIVFIGSYSPISNDLNTKLLFENDSIVDLFSFNHPNLNDHEFYDKTFIESNLTEMIIDYSEFLNDSSNLLLSISINEITKYLIYLLFIIIIIEIIFSNIKKTLRNE